ncbi:MAG: cell division protein ZapA [Ruminococcaceae bacterium]|nr:cell division protein ZapA [Oscillospiraceae bacterium]
MPENRVTLYINGINITLISDEEESYLKELSKETSAKIREIGLANIEKSAIITALSFLDEKKKLQKENLILKKENERLSNENVFYKSEYKPEKEIPTVKNPIKELYEVEDEKLTVYFAKKHSEETKDYE